MVSLRFVIPSVIWRAQRAQITRSLPPSTGSCAPVVVAKSGPHISAAISATSRLRTSAPSTLFVL